MNSNDVLQSTVRDKYRPAGRFKLRRGVRPRLISVGITGVGGVVPERVLTNADLEKMVDTSDEWIISRSGIRERRIAAPDETTSTLAAQAAQRALADAGVSAEDIDMIIVATATPDMTFPSTACLVQQRISAAHAAAVDISAGCSGFLYGLSMASQFIQAGRYQKVLVIGSETLSRIVNWEDRNTCVLFGDGAGAVVMETVADGYGVLSTHLGADGWGAEHLTLPAGGSAMPASEQTVHDKLHCIHMNGQEVFKFAVRVMSQASLAVLRQAGLKKTDIDFLIPHQANIRIIDSARAKLGLDEQKVLVNLDRYGNTSAASIPIALDEAVSEGRIKPGHLVLMVGFGAGLTWGSAVVRWGTGRH